MLKLAVWFFAGVGVLVCIFGAAAFATSQVSAGGGHFFPLPGLILIEWAVIGVLGFLSAIAVFYPQYQRPSTGIWVMTGALLPLIILGALSIGPLVLIAALFFLIAAILVKLHTKSRLLSMLGYWVIGAFGNTLIVAGLILFNSLLEAAI